MVKNLLIIHIEEDYEATREYLYDLDSEKQIFSVSDLWECPEDAIIGRDLIDAENVVDFIELGMKYAKEGYSEIKCFYKELTEEPDNIEEIIKSYKK